MVKLFRFIDRELLLTFSFFCAGILFFDLVTDDYGAFAYFNLSGGQFSDYPYTNFYFNGFVGIGAIYKFLYTCQPAINWMGVTFIFFSFIGLYSLLKSISNIVFKGRVNNQLLICVQIFFSAFYLENIISISHTRFSLIFCGISLFNLAFAEDARKADIVKYCILFILGILIRPESGIGMLILVTMGYLLYFKTLRILIKRILFPIVTTVTLFTVFAIDWHYTDMYFKRVEPEIEYKIMDKRIVPLSEMKTAADSAKYEAMKIGMWFDIHTLTPEYLRGFLLPGINSSYLHAIKIFQHANSFYLHYSFLASILILLLIAIFSGRSRREVILKIIAYQLLVYILIYLIDFNGRLVGERHFLNLQLIALLISCFYFFNSKQTASGLIDSGKARLIVFTIISAGTVLTLTNYKRNNAYQASSVDCYETAMQKMEDAYSGRVIVSTLSNVYLLNRNFSVFTEKYTKNDYIMFDVFTYSLAPHYLNYLSRRCKCDPTNPIEFFLWLAQNKAIYISEPYRFELTMRYMKEVHGQSLNFTAVRNFSKPDCISFTEMKEYDLREVSIIKDK